MEAEAEFLGGGSGGASFINSTISGNYSDRFGGGIYGSNVWVRSCQFWRNRSDGQGEAVYENGNASISNSIFHGFRGEATVTNGSVQHCTFVGEGTTARAIVVLGAGGAIENNVVADCRYGVFEMNANADPGSMRNNLFSNNVTHYMNESNTELESYADINGLFGASGNLVDQDPLFWGTSKGDFHIMKDSPCIDTGMDVGVEEDFDGKLRPFGLAPDIGAYEWDGNYKPSTGTVVVDVSPDIASWTFWDAGGVATFGTGSQVLLDVRAGPILFAWNPLVGYIAPPSPVTRTLLSNSTITFDNVYVLIPVKNYTMGVNVAGSGKILKAPDLPSYEYGTEVTLTAIPDFGYHFTGWSGDVTSATNPLTITMDANKTVMATFKSIAYTLALTASIGGSATATPAQAAYNVGSTVSLTATPDNADYIFSGWIGDIASSNEMVNPLTLTMDSNKAVTAIFEAIVPMKEGKIIRQFGMGTIKSVAFSPTGERILVGGVNATLLDAQTGEVLMRFFGHRSGVFSVAFSPDGTQVLTGSEDKTAKLWNTATGEEIRTFTGHSNRIHSVTFSPDGTQVLTGDNYRVKLWNTATGDEIRTFTGHSDQIHSVAFSPDGTQVLTGSEDKTAKLWNTATGEEIRTFTGHSNRIHSVTFSPDGTQVLTGDGTAYGDGTAKLWNAASGEEIRTFTEHSDGIYYVAFSPDGSQVLTVGYSGTVRLWNAASGEEIRAFLDPSDSVNSAVFSPDGTQVLTGSYDATAKLWKTKTGEEIRTFTGYIIGSVHSVAFSPDGTQVLTGGGGYEQDSVDLWDATTGEKIKIFTEHYSSVSSVAFSPDGTQVLTGSSDKTAKLWNVETGEEIRTFTVHPYGVRSVAFSPDGTQVLSGTGARFHPGWARLWNTASGGGIRTFTGHSDPIYSVAFSPDGTQVLTGSEDKTAKLWNTATGDEIRTFTGHSDQIHSVAFSPDGTQVLTGSGDHTAKLWNAATGEEIRTFTDEHYSSVWSVAFSPDGTQVLTGLGTTTAQAKLWNATTGEAIREFSGHSGTVRSVAFSPDGTQVLTGSDDKTAFLWESGLSPSSFLLTVGTIGNGTVTKNPNLTSYTIGTEVTLTATPDDNNLFVGWTGNVTSTENPLTFTMNSNKNVTATFEEIVYTLDLSSTAGGSAAADPAPGPYGAGAINTLTPTAEAGFSFTGWSGDNTSTDNPLLLTMDGDKTIVANFRAFPEPADCKITWKKSTLVKSELVDGQMSLALSAGSDKSSIKIQRLKKLPQNMAEKDGTTYILGLQIIPELAITGAFGKITCDARVETLTSDGAIKSITTKMANIAVINASSVGTIKMTALRDDATEVAGTTILTDGAGDMKLTLSGIVLEKLVTSQACKYIKLASKAWKDKATKVKYVSLGGAQGDIIAASAKTIDAKGASIACNLIRVGQDVTNLKASSKKLNGIDYAAMLGKPVGETLMQILAPNIKTILGTVGVNGVFVAGYDSEGFPTYTGAIKSITTKTGVIQGEVHVSPTAKAIKFRPYQGDFLVIIGE